MRFCILISGLPASGKSTLGSKIAQELGLAFIDKDDYLERLFHVRGVGDVEWRRQLSRQSDTLFQTDAMAAGSVVLVSHWRPQGGSSLSGTPTGWLAQHFTFVIELYCLCPVKVAAQRFMQRKRHPGHLDKQKTPAQVLSWMQDYQQQLPLQIAAVEYVGTVAEPPIGVILSKLSKHLEN